MARGSAATAEPEQEIPQYTHRQVLKILSGLMMAMLTAMISTSVISTALPTIVGELGGQDQLAWVASAALLTMTASTPLWGKLSDVFGRKLMFQSALLIFVLASVGAGLSQNVGQLIATRALQGLGVGGLSALAQVILGDVVEPRQRGRYAGYMGAVFGVATVAGPLLGGFIVDAGALGWRWCFYVCVPLALVAFFVIQKVLKLPKSHNDTTIDVFGGITITGAAAALMFLLSMGGDQFAWNSVWTYVLIGVTVVLTGLAVVAERTARDPILPPRLFRDRTFVVASIGLLCMAVAMFGAMIYMPQYLQIVKGMSPTVSGLMTLPLVVGMLITSTVSGQLVTRTGRYKIFPVVGMVFVAGSLLLLSRLHVDSSRVEIGTGLALLGIGLGLTLQILILAAQNSAARSDLASTTSGLSFFRNLGGAMGVAAFGSILTNRLGDEMAEGAREAGISLPAGGGGSLGSPDQIAALPEPIKHIVLTAFNNAVETVFIIGVPVAVLGFLVVLALKELPLRGGPAAAVPVGADGPQDGATIADIARPVASAQAGRHERTPAAPQADGELVGAGAVPYGTAASVNEMSRNGFNARTGDGTPRSAGADAADTGGGAEAAAAFAARPGGGAAPGGVPVRGVVRTSDGAPVPSAALTLIGVDGHQLARALTLADGRYALPTPGPGTYVLIAATGEHEPQAATLVVGDKPVEFDLLLAGNGGLTGTVRGADGLAVPNAMVVVTDVRGEVVGTGRTGPDGRYAFGDVVSGTYTLAVSAAAHRPVALPVDVGGNGQTVQDVEMPPGARVRGTVRNEAGQPVADARVTIVDAAGNVVAMMITGPDGEYAFADLTGGQYTVIASGYPPVATGLSLSGGGRDEHDLKLGHPEE
ncbi:MFS transporter [Actinomadura algeriensis]|uniref:EmrB/QacA subfamily drug resistance transporter n=1 Tax=Actinomadura algeriensis TaxID=1679523 RepID=A0ABR9JM93_9ACTN|nr:MFS transporter [Actinomadura algeriensis]MBE1531628.1 EmrB/QacA subfamily drug resistance transporter [Actinomadura algeriensis]